MVPRDLDRHEVTDGSERAVADVLHEIADQASEQEAKLRAARDLLDKLADLHNDLTDWAVSTEHELAALEVMAILECHIQKSKAQVVTVTNSADVLRNIVSDMI